MLHSLMAFAPRTSIEGGRNVTEPKGPLQWQEPSKAIAFLQPNREASTGKSKIICGTIEAQACMNVELHVVRQEVNKTTMEIVFTSGGDGAAGDEGDKFCECADMLRKVILEVGGLNKLGIVVVSIVQASI